MVGDNVDNNEMVVFILGVTDVNNAVYNCMCRPPRGKVYTVAIYVS